ncbi:MAG: M23 family metallopeptidase [bacterium]|nr:M23 family metallopeptidase [bacterium]
MCAEIARQLLWTVACFLLAIHPTVANAESRTVLLENGRRVEIINADEDQQQSAPPSCDAATATGNRGPVVIVFEGLVAFPFEYQVNGKSGFKQHENLMIDDTMRRPADIPFHEDDVPGKIKRRGIHETRVSFTVSGESGPVSREYVFCYDIQPRAFDGFDYPLSHHRGPYRSTAEDGVRFLEFPGFNDSALERRNHILENYDPVISGNRRYEAGDDYYFRSLTVDTHSEDNAAIKSGWWLSQDVGSYYETYSGLHSGEDWNFQRGNSDLGREVYAIAHGEVIRIHKLNKSSMYLVFVNHELPFGERCSVYLHVDFPSHIESHDVVERGELISTLARLGGGMAPHLHFEMRNFCPETGAIWPNDGGKGGLSYYKDKAEERAMSLMQKDGLLDPSDCIDAFPIHPEGWPRIVSVRNTGYGNQFMGYVVDLDGYNFTSPWGSTTLTLRIFGSTGDVLRSVDCQIPSRFSTKCRASSVRRLRSAGRGS